MDDQYPSCESLSMIEKWDFADGKGVLSLMEFLEGEWWNPEWGFIRKGKDVVHLELHTGGWSGNEEIMGALQKNSWFFFLYWEDSRRGGHYRFRIPLKRSADG